MGETRGGIHWRDDTAQEDSQSLSAQKENQRQIT